MNENKQLNIRKEYEDTAEHYDEDWSYYIEATTRETLKRLNLGQRKIILDVGCGTGALLRKLVNENPEKKLVGIDLSPEMLKQAQKKMEKSTPLISSDGKSLPVDDDCFDLVVSCNAFHFFIDPVEFLSEARRVLMPGGKLVITDWCDDYWACWLCDYYLRWTNEAHTKVYGGEEVVNLLQETGFKDIRIDKYKIDWIWGLMTAQASLPE